MLISARSGFADTEASPDARTKRIAAFSCAPHSDTIDINKQPMNSLVNHPAIIVTVTVFRTVEYM
jgi:hypothetical protein